MAFAAAACIVLAGYNNLAGVQPWHRRWYPAVNALAATATLAAAAASGLTPADLGLRRDRLRAGLRLGSAAAAPVVAAFGLAALTPAIRPLLNDQRIAELNRRQLAYHVLVRIPVGTVAWEEIAFRGVLQAALRRVLAEPAATAVGSAVFGLWHIRPTAEALAVNRLAAGRGARITAVTAVAAGTAGAGALLAVMRERYGSLAAPVLLHLAANCAAPLASARGAARRGPSAAAGRHAARNRGVRLAVRYHPARLLLESRVRARMSHLAGPGPAVHPAGGGHRGRRRQPGRAGLGRAEHRPARRSSRPCGGILAILPAAAGALAVVLLRRRRAG